MRGSLAAARASLASDIAVLVEPDCSKREHVRARVISRLKKPAVEPACSSGVALERLRRQVRRRWRLARWSTASMEPARKRLAETKDVIRIVDSLDS